MVTPSFYAAYIRNGIQDTDILRGTYALLSGVILNDLELLSKIFDDMKCRTVSLRQLSFLYRTPLNLRSCTIDLQAV